MNTRRSSVEPFLLKNGFSPVFQIGLGLLVATSTANIVAVPRTLPAIVMSASDTGGCCPASPSRRVLTLWSGPLRQGSLQNPWLNPFAEKPKVGGLQMDWLLGQKT
jgi:hypothetical protein